MENVVKKLIPSVVIVEGNMCGIWRVQGEEMCGSSSKCQNTGRIVKKIGKNLESGDKSKEIIQHKTEMLHLSLLWLK